jgi:hypothetical protein
VADLCDDADGGAHEVTVIPQHSGVPEYLCMLSFAIRGIELAKVVAPELVMEAANELLTAAGVGDQGDGATNVAPAGKSGRRRNKPAVEEPEYDANRTILGVTEDRPRPPGEVYAEHHANLVGGAVVHGEGSTGEAGAPVTVGDVLDLGDDPDGDAAGYDGAITAT